MKSTIELECDEESDYCAPNHLCDGRLVHLPAGELCDKCGKTAYEQALKDAFVHGTGITKDGERIAPKLFRIGLQHITDSTPCWCNPETTYTDPDTGISVIVHKEPQ